MDVYHKVLYKLNEVTGGKDSVTVDFKDLVKKIGFHGNYNDIFERLSREGWITETPKADFVKITHWGVKESKNAPTAGDSESSAELLREANRALTATKELTELLEDFVKKLEKKDFAKIESKSGELQNLLSQIKNLTA